MLSVRISACLRDNKGGEALRILRATAKKNGIQDMSLDEINEEIRKAREGIGD